MLNKLDNKINSFELIAEILSGCGFKCPDCFVDRVSDHKVTEKLYRVAEEFMAEYEPFLFFLGSTDIFTARNTRQLLADERLRALIMRFNRIVINSTMSHLEQDIVESIAGLGMTVQINIIIPRNAVFKDGYLQAVKRNVDAFREVIPDTVIHPQVNASTELKIEDYDAMNERFEELLGFGLDFNPSFTRESQTEEVFKREYRHIRKIVETSKTVQDGSMLGRHIDQVSLSDRTERTIFFINDNFYIAPILYEEAFQIKEKYRFETLKEYHAKMNELWKNQYRYAAETDECENCPYLTGCVIRNTLTIMEDYNITECLLPKKAILAANGWS